MSRNIPVNDQTFQTFASIKEAIGKLTHNKKITNDKFIEMLMNDFSMLKIANDYIMKDSLTLKELKDNGNMEK